jgi:hypothetical protein
MFLFLRTLVNWSTLVLNTVIDVLAVVDTLICDWECVHKSGISDSSINMPTDKIWTVLHAFTNFMCYAYTYNGVGISYTVAREVLSICEQFNVLQEQYPETDLVQLYIVYNKTRCLTTGNDAAFEPLLRRLVKIQCTDVKRLTVQRTYDHPVFGLRCGDITMSELVLDAKITMFDLIGLLAHIFDEEDTINQNNSEPHHLPGDV